MAERRMFAKSVITSARFLQMPSSTRLLYYDLGMAADDDGVVEAFAVIRMTNASEDDLKLLHAKGLIAILNDELVSYITDWKTNNLIRRDRYRESRYSALLVRFVGEKQEYSELPEPPEEEGLTVGKPEEKKPDNQGLTNGKPAVNPGKVRLGKDKTPYNPPQGERTRQRQKPDMAEDKLFAEFWGQYPRKKDKRSAFRAWCKLEMTPELFARVMSQLATDKQSRQWTKDGREFVPYPSTWLNRRPWEDNPDGGPDDGAQNEPVSDGWEGFKICW